MIATKLETTGGGSSPKKRSLEGDRDEWEDSRESSLSPNQARSRTRREPEANSPNSRTPDFNSFGYGPAFPPSSQPMDTGSPASYPKHVIVPSPPDSDDRRQFRMVDGVPPPPYVAHRYMGDGSMHMNHEEKIVTPTNNHEPMPMAPNPGQGGGNGGGHGDGYPGTPYSQQQQQGHYYASDPYGRPYGPPQTPPPYAPPPPQHHSNMGPGGQGGVQLRHKRWACDYCCVATFSSYEEACNHEHNCPRRQQAGYNRGGHGGHGGHSGHGGHGGPPPPPHQQGPHGMGPHTPHNMYHQQQGPHQPPPPHGQQQHHGQGPTYGGLGALYHASQEVQASYGGPHPPPHWNGPPMPSEHTGYPPLSPRFQDFRMYGDQREQDMNKPMMNPQRRLLLAMPADSDSLSDRQCYVRSEFVEVFAATEKDVAARHSKGAQKLVMGQVGIRCIHCAHLKPKNRAERAVCYPSSISRIYQTVADMQRFHFEQCREIPDQVRKIYKSLKTTRPRGVGSPQTYWVQSAKMLGMIDTEEGIRFQNDMKNEFSGPTASQQGV
uniref:Uncharacterized protein n=1 Tax=Grammatophora oceanica TaxID=210454 RepID=A0A7S1YK13_9STRA|mmetsp:Transcript_50854/g.76032  ORF Transcript_50854/g.76032 Transcript_50854/m.76032 type:complete len:547 (+) Transcript_50854:59-1699(+)